MRVVTLNTWKNEGDYPRRLALMASGLAALDADMVCLQECFIGAGQDTARFLAQALGLELHAALARAKPRLHDGEMVASSSGLAILTRHEGQGGGVLKMVSHAADGQRIAQSLDIAPAGRTLRILNTHLTHLRGASDLRGEQMRSALAWAEAGLAGGLVVAGDLNAVANAPELAALNAEGAFDLPTLLGAGLHAAAPPRPPIDHLVLQQAGDWRVIARLRALDQADGEGWYPSDHAAVVLDLA